MNPGLCVSSGVQQPGFVSWAPGGKRRDGGEEEREPADCGLSQLDARLCRNVRSPPFITNTIQCVVGD